MKTFGRIPVSTATLGILIGLTLAGGASLYLLTRKNIEFAERNPGGTDFLVAWEGMRSVVEGIDPYSDETADRIQQRFYGRAAAPGENELRVPYPIYSLVFLAPFYLIGDYETARGVWMTFAELATAALALLCVQAVGRQWTRWQGVVFLFFALVWYFGLRAIINGNVVVLTAFFLVLALVCLQKKWDIAAGIVLALSTFKPQVAVFPIACILLWLFFARRYRPIFSFFVALALCAGAGLLISPTWIQDDWREVMRYPAYNPPGNPESSLRAMFGPAGSRLGIAVSAAACIGLAAAWFRLRHADGNSFFRILQLTLVLAPLAGLQTDAGNQYVLLLPVAACLIAPGADARRSTGRFLVLILFLGIGVWALFLLTLERGVQPVQHPVMLFPLPLFLLSMMAWDHCAMRRRTAAGTAKAPRTGNRWCAGGRNSGDRGAPSEGTPPGSPAHPD
jgi:hypothetical protein